MNIGTKLFKFLASLIMDKFYGSVKIKFENGKITHIEKDTHQVFEYRNLPE